MSKKKTKKVFVVMGTCGEYSDCSEWPVRAFGNEKEAQREVVRLEDVVRPINATKGSAFGWAGDHATAVAGDPLFQTDYTGTHYYYFDVPLGAA